MVSSSTLVWPNSKVPPSTSPVARYNLRKFASEKADLDIDFAGSDQAEIVTAILAGCVQNHETAQPLSSDEIWLWSLKKRLQMLLVRIGGCSGQSERHQPHGGAWIGRYAHANRSSPLAYGPPRR